MHPIVRTVLLVAVLLSGALALPACTSWDAESVRAFRDDAAATSAHLSNRADALQLEHDALPETDPSRPAANAAIADLRARADLLDAAVARLDAVLTEASAPSDGLTIAAQGLGSLLPEPARLPLMLAGALAATLARAHQLKKGAGSIARSLETAMRSDPNLKEAFARNADTIRTIQTPAAQRIVDEQTPGKTRVRLPI